MHVKIEISEKDLKNLVKEYLQDKLNMEIEDHLIDIKVKSKQNYKSEWESASFKATYEQAGVK